VQANRTVSAILGQRIQSQEGIIMKVTELLLAELDHEAVGIRKTLEQVPEGKND
jgi:hypothetical protein